MLSVAMLRRIVRVHELRESGVGVDDIAEMLGTAVANVRRYLAVAKPDIPDPPDMSWAVRARCRGRDVDTFFPRVVGIPAVQLKEKAAWICRDCPVRRECRETAEANFEQFGVWGGVDFSLRSYSFDKRSGRVVVKVRGRRDGAFTPVS